MVEQNNKEDNYWWNPNFNGKAILDFIKENDIKIKLDPSHYTILGYLVNSTKSDKRYRHVKEKNFMLFTHDEILKQLPYLHIKRPAYDKKIKRLKDAGMIESFQDPYLMGHYVAVNNKLLCKWLEYFD